MVVNGKVRFMGIYKLKFVLLIFCSFSILGLSACATNQPVKVPFYLSGTPSVQSSKLPLRVGVKKFSEAKEFSLDLKNIMPSMVPQTSISDGFTDNFVNYLYQSNVFKSVHKAPFGSENLDMILAGRIIEIQTAEPDFDSAMGGAVLRGLTIVGVLIPQYQTVITTVELELKVNSSKGKELKTYIEKVSTENQVQTLGIGASGSIVNLLKRPGLMESMTKTFTKLIANVVRDKDELLAELIDRNKETEVAEAPKASPPPQSGSGSGFFVSKMGHVITNAHVVQSCKKVTIGDSTNKQITAEIINTDRSNDLALLKLSSLEMASAESKALIQKLSIVVVPTASTGLLRSGDVRLGEKVLVAGYPFGNTFSNTIKVTTGVVSATRGAGDNSGQFQLDAAVQPGNSGGPIYDSSGNIVGVVISQLNKKTFGSFVENMNFGIKASTVRQFLMSSGLSSKKSEQTEEKSTQKLAEIAKNQALMVICHQ
jgi:S1-C subfamily serine protease